MVFTEKGCDEAQVRAAMRAGASGYVKPTTETGTRQKLRRLLRRLQISNEDAELLQGMLRQIGWKIGGAGRNRNQP